MTVRVTVSKEARRDLIAIRDYIRNELCAPDSATRMIRALKKSIQSLEAFPGRGKPLDALLSVHTEYRYLLCRNYSIFYLEDQENVLIVRILHQRQDCLQALLPVGKIADEISECGTQEQEKFQHRTLRQRAEEYGGQLNLCEEDP